MNTYTLPPAPISYRLAAFGNATPPRPLAPWASRRADEAAQVNFECADARLAALANLAPPSQDFNPEAYANEIRALTDEALIAAFLAADMPTGNSLEQTPQIVALCDEINRRAEEFSRTNHKGA